MEMNERELNSIVSGQFKILFWSILSSLEPMAIDVLDFEAALNCLQKAPFNLNFDQTFKRLLFIVHWIFDRKQEAGSYLMWCFQPSPMKLLSTNNNKKSKCVVQSSMYFTLSE